MIPNAALLQAEEEIIHLRAALLAEMAKVGALREALRPFARLRLLEVTEEMVSAAARIYAATGAGEGE